MLYSFKCAIRNLLAAASKTRAAKKSSVRLNVEELRTLSRSMNRSVTSSRRKTPPAIPPWTAT